MRIFAQRDFAKPIIHGYTCTHGASSTSILVDILTLCQPYQSRVTHEESAWDSAEGLDSPLTFSSYILHLRWRCGIYSFFYLVRITFGSKATKSFPFLRILTFKKTKKLWLFRRMEKIKRKYWENIKDCKEKKACLKVCDIKRETRFV